MHQIVVDEEGFATDPTWGVYIHYLVQRVGPSRRGKEMGKGRGDISHSNKRIVPTSLVLYNVNSDASLVCIYQ